MSKTAYDMSSLINNEPFKFDISKLIQNRDTPVTPGVNGFNGGSLAGTMGTNFRADAGIPEQPPGMDFTQGMKNFSLGAQGVLGLAGAYNAYKQTGLMRDQLSMQKGLANRNLANSAVTTNLSLANQANLASQLTTGAEYGTPMQIAAEAKLKRTVDGSPIA